MADRTGPHDDATPVDAALAVAARHALHDEELIAAFATDGDAAEHADHARALIERCSTCRELHADLVAITAAVRSLDDAATAAAYIKAPRDFRLPVEGGRNRQAAGTLGRVAAALAGGIVSFGRPVGATLATFGVVGLLVGSVALSPLGLTTSAPGAASATDARAEYQNGSAANQAESTGEPDRMSLQLGPDSTDGRELESPKVAGPADDMSSGPAPISWLFAGSLAAVVLGAALLLAGARSGERRIPAAKS